MIEVLKQAYQLLLTEPHAPAVCDKLEVILRKAIAELESQEPVAWISPKGHIHFDPYLDSVPLYTHPPQRTWVGLTDEEICMFSMWLDSKPDATVFTAIEAKLKEKNT